MECVKIAKDSPIEENVVWIDDCVRHLVDLISSKILLRSSLHECFFDSSIYPPFWDNPFLLVPSCLLQRKEVSINNDDQPYPWFDNVLRYDGVVQARDSTHNGVELKIEACLIEVKSKYRGATHQFWVDDEEKLILGGRQLLYRLIRLIHFDAETMKNVKVVLVQHGGRYTRISVMSALSEHLLYLLHGDSKELPTDLSELDKGYEVISAAWKARKIIEKTITSVGAFLSAQETAGTKGRRGKNSI